MVSSERRRWAAAAAGATSLACVLGAASPSQAAAATDRTYTATAMTVADVATSIRADAAYTAGYTGKGVGVALIDTGVAPVQGLTSGNIVNGPDLSLESQVPSLAHLDGYGHGTHMAGIIAGRDNMNGTGFRGIAPDATLTSIKVGQSNGAVDVTQVMAAIDWVVKHRNDDPKNPIRIINLSYGLDCTDCANSPIAEAADNAVRAGILVVVAAGNTGRNVTVPATGAGPLVVGAVDSMGTTNPADDKPSSFSSNYGRAISLDTLAPGRSIVSLRDPGSYADTNFPSARVGDRFFKGSGTSQAAAVVSGAMALYFQKYPKASVGQARWAVWGGDVMSMVAPATELNIDTVMQRSRGALNLEDRPTIGTLQASRGSSSVYFGDQAPLTGENDLFGPFRVSDWVKASAAQTSWSGGSWMGHPWTGSAWAAPVNGLPTWAGATWSGRAWSGRAWSDVAWAGRAWSGRAWSGAAFTGSSWTGTAWTGAIWN